MTDQHDSRPGEVTRILVELREGDRAAHERLIPLVLDELRSIARRLMRDERVGHVLQPTALVNEAMLRLLGDQNPDWHHRQQFLAVAAGCMRRVLVDHARSRDAEKRGGDWQQVTLTESLRDGETIDLDVLALHGALEELAELDPRQATIVELRYIGGMTLQETAEHLGVGTTVVSTDWAMARAWLYNELTGDASDD
ncbi:MAG: ECF-type sigma factor [Acidobacteriota bacterium]